MRYEVNAVMHGHLRFLPNHHYEPDEPPCVSIIAALQPNPYRKADNTLVLVDEVAPDT